MRASAALWWSFALTGLTLALTGCGSAEQGSEPIGQTAAPLTFPNDQTSFDYFVSKGLASFQAAGIVGNLDQESGDDPNAVQAGGPGRGIAQWSVGGRWDTSGNDNAVWYANQHGQNVWSLTSQLDFTWYELTNFSGYGLGALRATTNVTDATVAFMTDFEACGQCDQTNRIAYAQAVLAAYGSIPYAATFVSQSFPLATTTLTMTEGQVIPSYIELKNAGTKAWGSSTHLGTTMPRDRKSAFADATWLAPNRPAGVTGTVAPGGTYKFAFDLAAPPTAGDYDEFFGVVEEGVAWFSDPGQGGPPDNQLEVKIKVVPGPPVDAGRPVSDARAPALEAAAPSADGGAGSSPVEGGSISPPGESGADAVSGDGGGGCSMGSAPSEGPPWESAFGVVLAFGALRARRRRRC